MTDWAYIKLRRKMDQTEQAIARQVTQPIKIKLESELRERIARSTLRKIELSKKLPRSCSFVPKNEDGVVLLFGRFYDILGFASIKSIHSAFPDCVAVRSGKDVRIEFEFLSSNFDLHGHDPGAVDLVVCWEKNKKLKVPILELKSELCIFQKK